MRRHFVQIGKPVLAIALVGVVLLLAAIAACPELHELIHHDAGKPDHECAVTMFVHGQVDSAVCEIIIPLPTGSIEIVRYFSVSVFSPAIENLPPGRAPPVPSAIS